MCFKCENNIEKKWKWKHLCRTLKIFDITANNWELKDVGDALQKKKNDCLEISETENKTIT